MSIESFIRAMPKADLHVSLEGAARPSVWLLLAEQNEIAAGTKNFQQWVNLLNDPDPARVGDLVRQITSWIRYPDDLTRVVYNAGVALAKENVRYTEVAVNPSLFMQNLSFEEMIRALNDGRDRAERGWNIKMRWVLVVPRSEPRRADETVRWATGASGKSGHVVGFGLIGKEDAQPVGQFERAFQVAHKKELSTTVRAGNTRGAEGILEALDHLDPARIVDGYGAADAPDVIARMTEHDIPLVLGMSHALWSDQVTGYADLPLRDLLDAGIRLVLTSDMPSIFRSSLSDEYLAAIEHNKLSIDEVESIALNALRYSFLPAVERNAFIEAFEAEYIELRNMHLASESEVE